MRCHRDGSSCGSILDDVHTPSRSIRSTTSSVYETRPRDRKPNAVERYTVDWETTCVMSACLPACVQEAELLMTNPRDAFRGQSKSPNIVPFHMLGILFLLCNSNFVFKTGRFSDIRLQKCCDLENWFRGPSRTLEISPFDRVHTNSY